MPEQILAGEPARQWIVDQLAQHEGGVASVLASYAAQSALAAWHEALRGVEEFINVLNFGLAGGPQLSWLLSCPIGDNILTDPGRMNPIMAIVAANYDAQVAHRFRRALVQAAEIDATLSQKGMRIQGFPGGLSTVRDAMNYYQSRRRHLVSLFYYMPFACRGERPMDAVLGLVALAPCIEHSCATITGLHQKLLLLEIYPDFHLRLDDRGAKGSHEFEALEANFLEAERVSVMAMADERRDQVAAFRMESTPDEEILSAQELRNNARAVSAAYAAFGADASFAAVVRLVIALSRRCEDDYFVRVPASYLETLIVSQDAIAPERLRALLVAGPGRYADQTNRYCPFVAAGDQLLTNVVLLSRFLYDFKNRYLASRRRFVIHSGFIFEDMVKRDLRSMGFEVTNAKRVGGRSEFDVVALLGDTIYNFQCKNNAFDLSEIETAPARVARANRRLVGYYRRALKKERGRQGLLQAEFGRTKIKHFVISRFPVVTDDPLIISYNRLAQAMTQAMAL
jgi:hypothetical protein